MNQQAHKSPSMTVVEMNHLVLPQHTNSLGTVSGDEKLRWEEAKARRAQRLSFAAEPRRLAEQHACVPESEKP